VMEARDGLEGLTKAEFRRPDLILLDLMMPDVSGGRMFDEMRNHPAIQDIPIVVVTGKPDAHEMFDDAIGEDNVIMKPFEADALVERIRSHIGDPE
jgi:DNA-binding response OmpR family regulator